MITVEVRALDHRLTVDFEIRHSQYLITCLCGWKQYASDIAVQAARFHEKQAWYYLK